MGKLDDHVAPCLVFFTLDGSLENSLGWKASRKAFCVVNLVRFVVGSIHLEMWRHNRRSDGV